MSEQSTELDTLRGLRAFATVTQFLHIFHEAFDLEDFDTDYFEQELVSDYSSYLIQLAVKMLRVLTLNRLIHHDTWALYLARQYSKRGLSPSFLIHTPATPEGAHSVHQPLVVADSLSSQANTISQLSSPVSSHSAELTVDYRPDASPSHISPIDVGSPRKQRQSVLYKTMFELDVVERIYTFYLMSEWLMEDPSRLRAKLKDEEDCIDWRVVPLGYDSRARTYWLFDDNRLYRESLPSETPHLNGKQTFKKATSRKGKGKPRSNPLNSQESASNTRGDTPKAWHEEDSSRLGKWEVLYVTLQDWESAGELFKRPRNVNERFLQQRLQDDIMPQVLAELHAKKKKQEMDDAIQRRKRSTRLKLKQAREQEQKRKEVNEIPKSPSRLVPLIEQEVVQRKEMSVTQRMSREQRLLERQNRLLGFPPTSGAPINGTNAGTRRHSDHNGLVQVTSANHMDGKSGATRDRKRKQDGLDSTCQHQTTSATKTSKRQGRKPFGKKRGRPPKYPRMTNVSDDEEEEDSWAFACICGVAGQNINDGKPMAACESCQVWQHIHCTDKMDRQLGRPPRNWDTDEFICKRCQALPRLSLPSPRPSVQLEDGSEQTDRKPETTLLDTATSVNMVHVPNAPQGRNIADWTISE
ncbi:hypothetical protein IWQ61_009284 [Dispira simplex]|nr:hypothetical protein IWQ61_009284 [Dispira simplex]